MSKDIETLLRGTMDARAFSMASAVYGGTASTKAAEPPTLTPEKLKALNEALQMYRPAPEIGAAEALQMMKLLAAECLRLAGENIRLQQRPPYSEYVRLDSATDRPPLVDVQRIRTEDDGEIV